MLPEQAEISITTAVEEEVETLIRAPTQAVISAEGIRVVEEISAAVATLEVAAILVEAETSAAVAATSRKVLRQ